MPFTTPGPNQPTHLEGLERRKSGRFRCVQTTCQFGQVTDISREGCRVVSRRPLTLPEGATVNLVIESQGMAVTVAARPASCRRREDKKYNIGFQFFALSDQTRRDLIILARAALDSMSVVDRPGA